VAWFKACSPVQAFEPRLSAQLYARWPDLVAEVLGYDETRAWLLLADAGSPLGVAANAPTTWLEVLPRYAELQRGEAAHAADHLTHGVPDLRLEQLPSRFEDLLRHVLPVAEDELERLHAFKPRLAEMCAQLAAADIPATVQHDDLHYDNVYAGHSQLRVLDWGDSSISHPFASLVVTFRFLEEATHLVPDDPWFTRLRDAYLEPWGGDLTNVFDLAMRVGSVAHACAWARQRDALPPEARPEFDHWFAVVLRRAIARNVG
jgi:hypothetical protein